MAQDYSDELFRDYSRRPGSLSQTVRSLSDALDDAVWIRSRQRVWGHELWQGCAAAAIVTAGLSQRCPVCHGRCWVQAMDDERNVNGMTRCTFCEGSGVVFPPTAPKLRAVK